MDPAVRQRYLATLEELVDRARDAGRLRENLTTADVISMLAAAATAEARDHDAAPGRLADLISASIFT
ncbi:SbtR family transcriptional regulator [Nocardia sp. NPDC001965]